MFSMRDIWDQDHPAMQRERRCLLEVAKRRGQTVSEIFEEAYELASYGLRASQLARLSGISDACANHMLDEQGYSGAPRTGRPKSSVRELLRDPAVTAAASTFLVRVEHLLKIDKSKQVLPRHVLPAIRCVYLQHPDVAQACDWERIVNMAFLYEEGVVALSTCGMCGTRVFHEVGDDGARRRCLLCRLTKASTVRQANPDAVLPFYVTTGRGFPAIAPGPQECRQRFNAILDDGEAETRSDPLENGKSPVPRAVSG